MYVSMYVIQYLPFDTPPFPRQNSVVALSCGIQVGEESVKTASQSKSNIGWISITVCTGYTWSLLSTLYSPAMVVSSSTLYSPAMVVSSSTLYSPAMVVSSLLTCNGGILSTHLQWWYPLYSPAMVVSSSFRASLRANESFEAITIVLVMGHGGTPSAQGCSMRVQYEGTVYEGAVYMRVQYEGAV
jgi:hypothetical protein